MASSWKQKKRKRMLMAREMDEVVLEAHVS
jgi:hypothetical protein